MDPQENGDELLDTALHIHWDEKTQDVSVKFDARVFKQWPFVLAVLEMAKVKCEQVMKENQMRQMQAAAMAAQQDALVRQRLGRNN